MDIELARFNMVEQQIRPWNVLDQKILDLFLEIPRENFVSKDHQKLAFADIEIPLSNGYKMLPPKIEAKMIQELQIQNSDIVLEIGTGNAYVTALMAKLAKKVYSIDLDQKILDEARQKLESQNIQNYELIKDDGLKGLEKYAPFNAIMIGGAIEEIPEVLISQLAPKGRLVAIVGKEDGSMQQALVIEKDEHEKVVQINLFETCVNSLSTGKKNKEFIF